MSGGSMSNATFIGYFVVFGLVIGLGTMISLNCDYNDDNENSDDGTSSEPTEDNVADDSDQTVTVLDQGIKDSAKTTKEERSEDKKH